jgi:protein XagA
MYKKLLSILMTLLLIGISMETRADWPVGKHRMALTPSYTYSTSKRFFNSNGQLENSPFDGRYTAQTIGLYGVVGIGRNTDFIFNVPLEYVTSKNAFDKISKFGVGDLISGIAFHSPSQDLKKYFTVKMGVIIPLYSNVNEPYLGLGSKGAFIGANYSFNVKKNTFAIVEGVFTRFFDQQDGPNQFNVNLIYGMELPKSNLLIFTLNHETSSSADKNFSAINQNANKDFMFGTFAASWGKKISRTLTPSIKIFYTIYGRNAGQSLGVSLSTTIKIP